MMTALSMSVNDQTASARPSPSSNFALILDTAVDEYKRLTGLDLRTHPLSAAFDVCNSPDIILTIFKRQAQAFDRFRKGDDRLLTWLDPTVQVLFALSATLGEGIDLPYSPANAIFTSIGVLLGEVKNVVASYDMLVHLFEHIQFFLQRLKRYTSVPLTTEMVELLGKIMALILSILALSIKTMKEWRITKFVKWLVGRTDVEPALRRLDTLTREEGLMTLARNLEVTHNVDHNVATISEVVQDVARNVKVTKELTSGVDNNVKTIKELTQNVESNVTTINEVIHHVHNNANATKELTSNVHDNIKVIEGVTRDIDENVKNAKQSTDELHRNQTREKLRTWLSPPNPSINHNIACNTQHDGTAVWFTKGRAFEEWKKNSSLLWIRGNPGSGKSILCSAIIEDIKYMREAKDALAAFYYFDFKDAAKRHLCGLLSSILMQLGDSSLCCWDVLYKLYASCKDGSEQPSEAALAGCLNNMLDLLGQIPIYVIVDALDECPDSTDTPSPRQKVLEFLKDLVERNHSNLYLCITSRPEQDIQATLNLLTSVSHCVSLHEEFGQQEDINRYIRFFVFSNKTMRRWRAEDKDLVINTLSERAGGMFRWVHCQLDALCRCFPSSIRRTLNELPDTLDDTYERILEGIPKQKRHHAHQLFQCLVAAIRPLRVDELAEVLTIEFDSDADGSYTLVEDWRPENPEEAVLSACSTLISVVKDGHSKIVQFSHFSVKEFLTSDRFRTSESDTRNDFRYFIRLDDAHTILARACLTVLLQLDQTTDQKRLERFPLAFYAAHHWVDHAKFGDVASRIQDAMEHLFEPNKPYLGTWIWIYDVEFGFKNTFVVGERPSLPEATPLYYAAFCGFIRPTEHLIITHGEDVSAKCGRFGSPLNAAMFMGHTDVARLLLDHGADLNLTKPGDPPPLWRAYNDGNLELMRVLLEHGADVDARVKNSFGTLLHDASRSGHAETVHLLLQHNANANATGILDMTPLFIACRHGHNNVAQLLIDYGADMNSGNSCNDIPLWIAYRSKHLGIMRLLLENGADVDSRDNRALARTLLHVASLDGETEVVRLLLRHNPDVNARTCLQQTPLHFASQSGRAEIAQLLLKHGADINAEDIIPRTPLDLVGESCHDAVKLLLEHGAKHGAKRKRAMRWTRPSS